MKKIYTTLLIVLWAVSSAYAVDPLTLTVDTVIDNLCRGGTEASIQITVSGGTEPYQYHWEGPLDTDYYTEDTYNLIEGVYDLTVQDAEGLVFEWDTVLYDPNPNSTFIENSRFGSEYQITCSGDSTGWIEVRNALGNGPDSLYTYLWTMPSGDTLAERHLYDLPYGNYHLTVIDTIGCIDTTTVNLAQPPLMTIESVSIDNGSITITDNGDDRVGRSHIYHWTGPSGVIEEPVGLSTGTYHLQILDSTVNWTCKIDTSFTIIVCDTAEIQLDITHNFIYGGNTGYATVKVLDEGTYTHEWHNTHGWIKEGGAIHHAHAGIYAIRVTDTAGCQTDKIFEITQPPLDSLEITKVDTVFIQVTVPVYDTAYYGSTGCDDVVPEIHITVLDTNALQEVIRFIDVEDEYTAVNDMLYGLGRDHVMIYNHDDRLTLDLNFTEVWVFTVDGKLVFQDCVGGDTVYKSNVRQNGPGVYIFLFSFNGERQQEFIYID